MDIGEKVRKEAAGLLAAASGTGADELESLLERPPQGIDADLALPCFVLAKSLRKSPAQIAQDLAAGIRPKGAVRECFAQGPYLNVRLDWGTVGTQVLKQVLKEKAAYGRARPKGAGRKLMVEFAHPNTHKAFHIGHVRNICTGGAVSSILEAAGHRVIRANYQGDIGPHVAKCLWGFLNIYKGRPPARDRGRWLGKVYREASKAIAGDPGAEAGMREINAMLYARDSRILPVWRKTRQWSLEYFDGIYRDFGVKFDRLYFETEVEGRGLQIARDLVGKGVARESDGAIIADLKAQGLGISVLVTGDGIPLYHAKDLGLAEMQMKEYHPDAIIHVVGSEQTMYFMQLFRLLEAMGWPYHGRERHLRYELVNLSTGKKMKSREGEVILYDDLKVRLVRMAARETRKRRKGIGIRELRRIANLVAMGALKYSMVGQSPEKIIVFDWDRALSFEGNTGPYIQYTHARACSILRKSGLGRKAASGAFGLSHAPAFKPEAITDPKEFGLLRKLTEYPAVVLRAAEELRPSLVANYAYELAEAFNELYQAVPVLKAGKGSRDARLAMVAAAMIVLANALGLLGIEAPESM
jgi:arginyl-tRNA synthetase